MVEIAGRAIGLIHYPEIGQHMAESGASGAVFSGHDHQRLSTSNEGRPLGQPGRYYGAFRYD